MATATDSENEGRHSWRDSFSMDAKVTIFGLFLILVIMVGTLAYNMAAEQQRRVESQAQLRQVMTCLLASHNEHRVNTLTNFQVLLDQHEIPPPPPDKVTLLEALPEPDVACMQFLPVLTPPGQLPDQR